MTADKLYSRSVDLGIWQGRERLMRRVSENFYRRDGSTSYAVNEAAYQHLNACLRQEAVEGVVYHVLKGQIEYDFELERTEALLESYGIPLFRLETDYQYQDVEQLRIRMEAFSEMLMQNRRRGMRKEKTA